MKLALGTANFSSVYGINISRVKKKELNKIFNYCKKNKIIHLDTAVAYNNHDILNGFNLKKLKIITKLINLEKFKKKDIRKEIINTVETILKNLNIKQIYGLLLHDIKPMYSSKSDVIFKTLLYLKKKKLIKKIGISCYQIKDLNLIKNYSFNIVQFPLNIFDQRLIDNKVLQTLKKKKIEIHIRSIFLQGLLLRNYKKIPKYFSKWKKEFLKLEYCSRKLKKSKFELCINFIKQFNFINMIVVGVDTEKQLDLINKKFKNKHSFRFDYKLFSQLDKKLILPYLWKINEKK